MNPSAIIVALRMVRVRVAICKRNLWAGASRTKTVRRINLKVTLHINLGMERKKTYFQQPQAQCLGYLQMTEEWPLQAMDLDLGQIQKEKMLDGWGEPPN